MEYVGYAASVIILVSLLMSSVRKLRWINLIGSVTFAVYGFLIGSLPVALLNIGTVSINIYYLYNMYLAKDYFTILPITGKTRYFEYFLNYYERDIKSYMPTIDVNPGTAEVSVYILRNIVPAGVLVCSKHDGHTLKIDLDYVVPTYRDFKIGKFVFTKQKALFLDKGYDRLVSFTHCPKHMRYLEKMGFTKNENEATADDACYEIHLGEVK